MVCGGSHGNHSLIYGSHGNRRMVRGDGKDREDSEVEGIFGCGRLLGADKVH